MVAMNDRPKPNLRKLLSGTLAIEFVILAGASCLLCAMRFGLIDPWKYPFWKQLHLVSGIAFVILAVAHMLVHVRGLFKHLFSRQGIGTWALMLVIAAATTFVAWDRARPDETARDLRPDVHQADEDPTTEATTYATPKEDGE
jgi:uncharacterized membrane protein